MSKKKGAAAPLGGFGVDLLYDTCLKSNLCLSQNVVAHVFCFRGCCTSRRRDDGLATIGLEMAVVADDMPAG